MRREKMTKEKIQDARLGTSISYKNFETLKKISRELGRTMSDLIKEGLWIVITKEKNEQKGEQKNEQKGE